MEQASASFSILRRGQAYQEAPHQPRLTIDRIKNKNLLRLHFCPHGILQVGEDVLQAAEVGVEQLSGARGHENHFALLYVESAKTQVRAGGCGDGGTGTMSQEPMRDGVKNIGKI